MRKSFLFISLALMSLCACKKKMISADVIEITSPTTDRLHKIKFFSSEIGFAVGGQQFSKPTLLKTIDGGLTWREKQLPTNVEQKEIYNLDIFPDGRMITVGYGGTIFTSTDTGNTFQYVQHNSWKELKDVSFKDSNIAFIIGGVAFNKGHISKFTMDGSVANNIKEQRGFEICDIDFMNATLGYLSGYGAVMKTTDGGESWQYTAAKNDFFKAMCWKNSEEGIAVGYEGFICKTTNGGEKWENIRNGNSLLNKKLHFYDVARNTANTIVAVGENGCAMVSTDDGDSWKQIKSFTHKDLRGVYFSNNNTCFMVGDEGSLFRLNL